MSCGKAVAVMLVTILVLACSSSGYFDSHPRGIIDDKGNLVLPIGPFLVPAVDRDLLVGAQLPDGKVGAVEVWTKGQWKSAVTVPMAPSWDRFSYARLAGLKAGQRYQYRIVIGDKATAAYSVLAPPPGDQPFTFIVMGDSKLGCRQAHCKIVRQIEKHRADLYIHLGDLVRSGDNIGDWTDFFQIQKGLLARMPIAPAMGNHDRSRAGFFEKIFLLPQATGGPHRYFAFNFGNSLFVVLDAVGNIKPGGDQLRFFEEKLQKARQDNVEHIFVAVHSPLYSSGKHGSDLSLRAVLSPLLKKYGVTAVFSGHDHHYERSKPQNGVVHFISGGAGAQLTPVDQKPHAARVLLGFHFLKITVDGPEVTVRAVSAEGQVLDEVMLK